MTKTIFELNRTIPIHTKLFNISSLVLCLLEELSRGNMTKSVHFLYLLISIHRRTEMEVETGYSQAIQKSIFFDCVKLDRLLFLGACLITPKHSDEINNLSE